ncbi:MAG: hypothetical protein JST75_21590 [Bacteroidetes bacterium]|nr:hypothetical protein [Bacteroidota bacterium]
MIDYGTQVAENLSSGKSLKESLTHVDGGRILTSAVVGFVTDGVANLAGKVIAKETSAVIAKVESSIAKIAKNNIVKDATAVGQDIIKKTGVKLSKVEKAIEKTEIGGGKFVKTAETRPGIGEGQSRAVFTRVKNAEGKVVKTYKDSYNQGNKFMHRKPLTGGPEGRVQ